MEELRKLISEVKPKLIDAIAKLSKITIPYGEIELIAENAAQSLNAAIGEFIEHWKQLEGAIKAGKLVKTGNSTFAQVAGLSIFDSQEMADYRLLMNFRNLVVHHGEAPSLEEIRANIDKTKNLLSLMRDGMQMVSIDITDIDPIATEKSIRTRVYKEYTTQDFLDDVYRKIMSELVPAYTYGTRWILVNQETNTPLQKIGSPDQRPISELGISSKTKLRVALLPVEPQGAE